LWSEIGSGHEAFIKSETRTPKSEFEITEILSSFDTLDLRAPFVSRISDFGFAISDDIIFSHRNVNQIPRDMHERRMDFLDPMNAIRRNHKTVIDHIGELPAILAKPRDRQHLLFARRLERVDQIRRFAAGADRQRHIARLTEQVQLVHKHARKVRVVAIQGLNKKLQQESKAKDAEIEQLQTRLERLETLMHEIAGDAK
jgi:hypothetical protein